MLLALVAVALMSYSLRPTTSFGSVSRGSEYHATTTRSNLFQNDIVIDPTSGIFGSVVITGAAAGVIELYDATTSNVNLRTGNTASSTILLASFPASAATGTYTFDQTYNNGLLIHVVGTMPTTTVTWR